MDTTEEADDIAAAAAVSDKIERRLRALRPDAGVLQRKHNDFELDSPEYWEAFIAKSNQPGNAMCSKCERLLNSRIMYHHKELSYKTTEANERRDHYSGRDDKVTRVDIYTCYACGSEDGDLAEK